jgi:hypothetical protein
MSTLMGSKSWLRGQSTGRQAIVMEFRQGLDLSIQSHIALILDWRPKDDDPPAWYTAARTVALTCTMNEAFHAPRVMNSNSSPSTGLRRAEEPQARFTTPIRPVMAPAALSLGYPWLWNHNPEVNWQTQEVTLS